MAAVRSIFITHHHPDHNIEYGPLLVASDDERLVKVLPTITDPGWTKMCSQVQIDSSPAISRPGETRRDQ
jgi:ribonuclease BN (tRNA processing enzyme)